MWTWRLFPGKFGRCGERISQHVDYPNFIANVDGDFISVGADGHLPGAEHISQAADLVKTGSIHVRSEEIVVNSRLPMWMCGVLRRPVVGSIVPNDTIGIGCDEEGSVLTSWNDRDRQIERFHGQGSCMHIEPVQSHGMCLRRIVCRTCGHYQVAGLIHPNYLDVAVFQPLYHFVLNGSCQSIKY